MTSVMPAAVKYLRDVAPRAVPSEILEAMKADCGLWLMEADADDEAYTTVFDAYRLIDCVLSERTHAVAPSPPQGSEARTPG